MANTYSQIYFQIVFAVKYREALILPSWEEDLRKYITGIIQNKGHKVLAIGNMPDHIHLFIDFKPISNISDLVREIKKSSTHFINDKRLSKFKFQWQEGYGAFSYSKRDVPKLCDYVANQKENHSRKSFRDEYIDILNEQEIDFEEQYLFNWL